MNFVSLRKYLEMSGSKSGEGAVSGPACAEACQAWLAGFDELFPRPSDEPDSAGELLTLDMAFAEAGEGQRGRVFASALELARLRRASERETLRRRSDEVRKLVATFNEAVLTLASGGEAVAERFRCVEASLVRAARMDDLTAVRGCLKETIEMMQREARTQEEETAARVAEFEAGLQRARTMLPAGDRSEEADRQRACRLIRAEVRGARQGEFSAVVVVFDRMAAARARFGPQLVAEAMGAFARARAEDSAAGGLVYRWNEQALFWRARPGREPAELRAAMEEVLGRPFDYRTVVGGRPAVLALYGRWLCAFPVEGEAEALIEEIDRFTGAAPGLR